MKLSAPPPPPPEPNEPEQPSPEQPAASDPVDSTMPPVEQPAAKTILWPVWFTGADFLLAVLVLALGFLVASFVARNTDIWLHLAAGQRLFAGSYTPGTDPFSYSGADRPWVNHSLFFDIGAYLLYSGSGATLVVIKALAVVLAFGLLIGIRRIGFPLWPWAAVAGVAVVAAAPYLSLRPQVGSILLLSVTMFLLFRMRHTPGSWRFPAAIGVTFWIWANTDEWFFLGPLALALVLAGEWIQTQFTKPVESETEEPLGKLPDVPTLAKALGIGVLACMLNPHHIRVWELPFELIGSKEAMLDIRFRQLLLTPLDRFYIQQEQLGYNLNGLAYAVLFVGGGAALGLAGARLRFAHLALWLGFALLTLQSVYAIPFLAVVAVPLIAGQLNAFSVRLRLKSWGDPKTRFVLLGSAGGRVLLLVATVVACVLAWPGWMVPPRVNEAYTQRVAWAIEPDEAMKIGALKLQTWRASRQLPPEARGLISSVELANYCAWFAPDEKVYFNGQYNHHRPELHDFITIRSGRGLIGVPPEQRPSANEVLSVFDKLGLEYFVIHSGPGDPLFMRAGAQLESFSQWVDSDHWSPWYLDGRTTISGWRRDAGATKPTFAALRLDPVLLAFGPSVERLPPGTVNQMHPSARWLDDYFRPDRVAPGMGWEESFLHSPRLAPLGADETFAWLQYGGLELEKQNRQRGFALDLALHLTDRFCGGSGSFTYPAVQGLRLLSPRFPPPATDSIQSIPFLALRAARQAIATNGDHPDGYYALAMALADPAIPLLEGDRVIGRITALRQCLNRLPPPEQYRPGVYLTPPSRVAFELAKLYLGRRPETGTTALGIPVAMPAFYLLSDTTRGFLKAAHGRIPLRGGGLGGAPTLLPYDMIREMLQLATKYMAVDPQGNERQVAEFQKEVEKDRQIVERELARANTYYERMKAQAGGKLEGQANAALANNLVGESLRLLKEADSKDLTVQISLSRVALELAVGQLEDASADLEAIASNPNNEKWLTEEPFHSIIRSLVYQKCVFEGNYIEAGNILVELQGKLVGLDPLKDERAKFDPKPFVALGDRLGNWAIIPLFTPSSALDVQLRMGVVEAALGQYAGKRGFAFLQSNLEQSRELDAEFFFRCGLLALIEGNISGAKARFLQTRLPANKDWGLPEFRYSTTEEYLRLIEEAEKKAPKK